METRRAKWRRLAQPECTSAEARGTYFALLDLELRTQILRYFSTRPVHLRWRAFINPNDAVRSFEDGHPLRGAARATLTSLHVHYGYAQVRERIACGIQIARAGGYDSFSELLAAQAARLKVLTLDFDYDYSFLCGAVYVHCTQLRVLILGFDHRKFVLSPILAACGKVLQVLHLAYEPHLICEHVDAIGKYCTNVRELSLDHETTDESMQELWRSIGATLQRITVWPPRIRFGDSSLNKNDMEIMSRYCTQLRDIEITRSGRKMPISTASMLYNLGARLLDLRFMQKDAVPLASELASILSNCPNVQLHLNLQRDVVSILALVGDRLKEAKIRHNFNVDDKFKQAANSLSNLEVLTIFLHPSGIGDRAFLEALFTTPKRRLRKLVLPRTYYKEPGNPCALPTVANGTGALRDVELWVSKPCNAHDIICLLEANSKIERLWIWNRIKSGSSTSVKQDVVRAAASVIKAITKLKEDKKSEIGELVIKDQYIETIEELISNCCVPLRYKNEIDVIVGSVRYVPDGMKLQRKTIQY